VSAPARGKLTRRTKRGTHAGTTPGARRTPRRHGATRRPMKWREGGFPRRLRQAPLEEPRTAVPPLVWGASLILRGKDTMKNVNTSRKKPPRSEAAVLMQRRAQGAGPHKDKRNGRGNPRTEARRTWRADAS